MDQQKKHRKVLHAAFTKSANELDKLLSEEAALQQVQVAWEVLLQKHEDLLIANRKIYDTLLQEDVSEEDLMVEIDSCEGYDKKFMDLRITYGNRRKHVDIGLDEDDRRSRASLAVSKSTLGPVYHGCWLEELKHKNIQLNDVHDSAPIELLIGADVGKTGRRIFWRGLVAVETLLGWTLMGKKPHNDHGFSLAMTVMSLFFF
ncbi:hypothetical protein JTB14_006970 [Gonioctena quinquepunctata]|nr:hypothetical protein JTB14_006970 [Gonioctena quinquepunctata]